MFYLLSGTEKCIISFVDYYRKVHGNFERHGIQEMEDPAKRGIAAGFSAIARTCGLRIETCAEEIDLQELGIDHARCIDPVLIGKIDRFTGDTPEGRQSKEGMRMPAQCRYRCVQYLYPRLRLLLCQFQPGIGQKQYFKL